MTLPKLTEGSEHLVYLDQAKGDVVKLTRPRIFGESYFLVDGVVNQKNCTPFEYLVRLRLWKKLFGFAPLPLGITGQGQIVSRQRFIRGDPPSQEAVDRFLESAGLVPVKRSCWLWKSAADLNLMSVWVGDARCDNFVARGAEIIPIDLRLWIS